MLNFGLLLPSVRHAVSYTLATSSAVSPNNDVDGGSFSSAVKSLKLPHGIDGGGGDNVCGVGRSIGGRIAAAFVADRRN